jgi:pentatricopeptide repeat protein
MSPCPSQNRPSSPAAYTTAINNAGQVQQLRRALELVGEMRARGIPCNVHTYSALMNVCIKVRAPGRAAGRPRRWARRCSNRGAGEAGGGGAVAWRWPRGEVSREGTAAARPAIAPAEPPTPSNTKRPFEKKGAHQHH